mmetsp:Transcript_27781/g.70155  ORF Transcript_27781/g.70155 Transcript_27781/m.70155 type:complete len:226 (-) Transcript_27781:221-898(-)
MILRGIVKIVFVHVPLIAIESVQFVVSVDQPIDGLVDAHTLHFVGIENIRLLLLKISFVVRLALGMRVAVAICRSGSSRAASPRLHWRTSRGQACACAFCPRPILPVFAAAEAHDFLLAFVLSVQLLFCYDGTLLRRDALQESLILPLDPLQLLPPGHRNRPRAAASLVPCTATPRRFTVVDLHEALQQPEILSLDRGVMVRYLLFAFSIPQRRLQLLYFAVRPL